MIFLITILVIQILFILYLNKLRVNHKLKLTLNRIAVFSAMLFYVLLMLMVIYLKFKYQNELDTFDLNKDGFFSGNEINETQQEAMKNVISDTGRNFAPFTGIVFSIIYYIILLPILIIIDKNNSQFKRVF